ncbi:putative oxidoreductase, chloroplastic [Auxenochlorella protothecoides]|uniref:Putative oxidoreductase, chloroplastic n=1 Tax=Auxenochlorella protothecoides TaxID=3075 RepID=A0A087SAT6_AUXPR|nr:putative oxidoreductase, chloroplastic [Auxenochlorella protothecoides]KFM22840.1 putative oxidoreductase, chloroplastic [Auxenochlorella protothecoides]
MPTLNRKPASERDGVPLGPHTVSPMGLGTWAWGNKLLWGYSEGMDSELQQVFDLALQSGINLMDTADSYGTGRLNGRSERLLGNFMRDSRETRPVIATKLAAYPWRLLPGQWVAAARASSKRLGLERVPVIQLHWSTAKYAPIQERLMWDGLCSIYKEGLAEAVGVSNYGAEQLARIHDYLDARGVPLASAQVQYSLLSRGGAQESVRREAEERGIALIAYSPLALGMLSGKYGVEDGEAAASLPQGPRALLFKQILPGAADLLQELRQIAQARGKTVPQVALNWCICQGTIPIPGATSLAQFQDSLGALGWRLTREECGRLEEASDAVPRAMLQNIFQTA